MEPRVIQQLANAGHDAAHRRRRAGERPRPGDPRLFVDDHVARGHAVRDGLVGVEAASGHPEREEQELADGRLVGLAGRDLDQAAEDREARVRVVPDLAERRELLQIGHRGDVFGERVVALAEIGEAVAEPAPGVRDEVAQRRARSGILVADPELRKVAADRRVEVEGVALDQAIWNSVSPSTGRGCSMLVTPYAAMSSSPSWRMPIATPGTW